MRTRRWVRKQRKSTSSSRKKATVARTFPPSSSTSAGGLRQQRRVGKGAPRRAHAYRFLHNPRGLRLHSAHPTIAVESFSSKAHPDSQPAKEIAAGRRKRERARRTTGTQ